MCFALLNGLWRQICLVWSIVISWLLLLIAILLLSSTLYFAIDNLLFYILKNLLNVANISNIDICPKNKSEMKQT